MQAAVASECIADSPHFFNQEMPPEFPADAGSPPRLPFVCAVEGKAGPDPVRGTAPGENNVRGKERNRHHHTVPASPIYTSSGRSRSISILSDVGDNMKTVSRIVTLVMFSRGNFLLRRFRPGYKSLRHCSLSSKLSLMPISPRRVISYRGELLVCHR